MITQTATKEKLKFIRMLKGGKIKQKTITTVHPTLKTIMVKISRARKLDTKPFLLYFNFSGTSFPQDKEEGTRLLPEKMCLGPGLEPENSGFRVVWKRIFTHAK